MKPSLFSKQPYERRQLEFDVSPSIPVTAAVSGVASAVVTDALGNDVSGTIIDGAPSFSGNKVYVAIHGGTNGQDYKLTLKVLATNGDKIEEELAITIREL